MSKKLLAFASYLAKVADQMPFDFAKWDDPKDMLVYWTLDGDRIKGNLRSRGKGANPVRTSTIVEAKFIDPSSDEINSNLMVATSSGSVYVLGKHMSELYEGRGVPDDTKQELLKLVKEEPQEEVSEPEDEGQEIMELGDEDIIEVANSKANNLLKLAKYLTKRAQPAAVGNDKEEMIFAIQQMLPQAPVELLEAFLKALQNEVPADEMSDEEIDLAEERRQKMDDLRSHFSDDELEGSEEDYL